MDTKVNANQIICNLAHICLSESVVVHHNSTTIKIGLTTFISDLVKCVDGIAFTICSRSRIEKVLQYENISLKVENPDQCYLICPETFDLLRKTYGQFKC